MSKKGIHTMPKIAIYKVAFWTDLRETKVERRTKKIILMKRTVLLGYK